MAAIARIALLLVSLAALALPPPALPADDAVPASPRSWPQTRDTSLGRLTLFQPQLEEWDGVRVTAQAAFTVVPPGTDQTLFGSVQISAATRADRAAATVSLDDVRIEAVTLPSSPQAASRYAAAFRGMFPHSPLTVPLERFETALAVERAARQARAQPLGNVPPQIVFSSTPAVLVIVDGPPAWREVEGTPLVRALNTRALLLRGGDGTLFVHVLDGWMQAPALAGPWTVSGRAPDGADDLARELSAAGAVDLLSGPAGAAEDEDGPGETSLAEGAPRLVVVDRPTELIVTEGAPAWAAVPGTSLRYATNTTGNVFEDARARQTYVLVSGRWFRADSLAGPWTYVAGPEIPADFARIPDDSPKENVKASVPGTAQAQEAVAAAEVPKTARVNRRDATFQPWIDGAPDIRPIEGTELHYVANSPTPIIEVSPTQWVALQDGVWFGAAHLAGPWVVATQVPPVIYTIPPSSPLYSVTFVKVYDADEEWVEEGYTPGYMGTYVAPGPVVVYGTGYWYQPWIGPGWWYGEPWTYGFAVGIGWTPWLGWGFGFGFGWGWGAYAWGPGWGYGCAPWWGAYPWYHGVAPRPVPVPPGHPARPPPRPPPAWGPRAWAANSSNVYRRWGTAAVPARSPPAASRPPFASVGHSYNSRTGGLSAGQAAPIPNAFRPAIVGRGGAGAPPRGGWVTPGRAPVPYRAGRGWGAVPYRGPPTARGAPGAPGFRGAPTGGARPAPAGGGHATVGGHAGGGGHGGGHR